MSRCGEGRNSQIPVLQLHVVSDSDLEGVSDRFSNRAESARVYLECTMAALCNSTWNGTRSLCLLTFIGHTLPWDTQKELLLAAKMEILSLRRIYFLWHLFQMNHLPKESWEEFTPHVCVTASACSLGECSTAMLSDHI